MGGADRKSGKNPALLVLAILLCLAVPHVVRLYDKQGKEKKVVTFKYKSKKHTHTKQGHRQPYTKVTINKINA